MEHGDPKAKANDKGLKNVFRWPWVDEDVGYTDKDGNPQTVKVKDVLFKCVSRGNMWCKICDSIVTYGSSGKKALTAHLRQKKNTLLRWGLHQVMK